MIRSATPRRLAQLGSRQRLRTAFVTGVVALFALTFAQSSHAATTYTVPSTIASDCSVDVTQPLLSWIASVPNDSILSFGAGKCYRVEGTIELRNRSALQFDGNGSTFKSLNPPDDQRAMWRVVDSTGFAFRNMTIKGSYASGGTFASGIQHAHGIDLRGTNADVGGVTFSDLGGDCVYFGQGYSSALTRSSGSVHDSSCSRIGRNGISVTAADDVRVERVTTSAIGYIVFDVEPNTGTGWGSRNITFDNNTIGSYYLYAYAVVQNALNANQTFSNNKVVGGKGLRVGVVAPGGSVRPQNVTITGNSADTATWSPALEFQNVDGLTVTNNVVPMSGGTMATVTNSCNVAFSGNTFPGGSAEKAITSPSSTCSTTPPPPPPADQPAPTATVTSPSDGSMLTGTTTKITAKGSTSAVKMELYVDGTLKATSSSSSISATWNTKRTSSGNHTITARAYDASNQTGSASVTVTKR
jgi:Bacterial Ig domain